MNLSRSVVLPLACVVAASFSFPLRAAETNAPAGRALVKRYADAVVGVELVVTLKVKVGGSERPPQEQKIEVNGTVISSSGLTLTSLAEVDPQTTFDAIRANSGGRGPELVGVEYKEVKLRLADGKEVPARFVLKDADLDLAFMAPDGTGETKPEFAATVKLEDAAEGGVLNTYYCVSRAAKALQRVPLVRSIEVVGVVEKPRRFYLPSDQNPTSLGAPALDANGKVLGIFLQNFASGRRTGQVILPAADIAEMAKQAAAAQAAPAPATTPAPAADPTAEKKGGQ